MALKNSNTNANCPCYIIVNHLSTFSPTFSTLMINPSEDLILSQNEVLSYTARRYVGAV